LNNEEPIIEKILGSEATEKNARVRFKFSRLGIPFDVDITKRVATAVRSNDVS